jgi:hypothetical protein
MEAIIRQINFYHAATYPGARFAGLNYGYHKM